MPEPLAINIGAAARLGMAIAAISAGCLSILGYADTWFRFRAQLNTPSSEGVVNLFGGIALGYKQFCPKYANDTSTGGQPLIAPVQCLSQSLALDGSDGPNYNTTYNKSCMAALGITIAACVFIIFLVLSAPSEKARRAWKNGQRPQQQQQQSAQGRGEGEAPSRPASTSFFSKLLSFVDTAHTGLLCLLPLHLYIPIIALPCSLLLLVCATLWIDGANAVGTDTLITTITGYDCETACQDGYNTIPGPGAIGAVTASLLLLVSSCYLLLRWAFPTCCPSLLDMAVDAPKQQRRSANRYYGSSLAAAGIAGGAGGLDGGRIYEAANEDEDEDDDSAAGGGGDIRRGTILDDDDDDEEDGMFIRPSALTGASRAASSSSIAAGIGRAGSKLSSLLLPGITTIDQAISGLKLVKEDEENAAEAGSTAPAATAGASGTAVAAMASSSADALPVVPGPVRKHALSPAATSGSGVGIQSSGSVSILPMLLHRMSMSAPADPAAAAAMMTPAPSDPAAAGAASAAAAGVGIASSSNQEGQKESLLGSTVAGRSFSSAAIASLAGSDLGLSPLSPYHPSPAIANTSAAAAAVAVGAPAWIDIEADRNPEMTFEHESVKTHPGAAAVFRLLSVMGLVLTAVAYGVDFWSFRFEDSVDVDSGGIKWYGGLGINVLTVRYPQTPSQDVSLTVFLRYAFQPIQKLAAPTIISAFFITVAIVCAMAIFGVMQPYENLVIRALLFSPCRRCKCARGGVMGQTTVELKEMMRGSSSPAAALSMAAASPNAPWNSIKGWEREQSQSQLTQFHSSGSFSSVATGAGDAAASMMFVPPSIVSLEPSLSTSSMAEDERPAVVASAADAADAASLAGAVVMSNSSLRADRSREGIAAAAAREARVAVILLHSCRAVDRVAASCRFAFAAAFSCLFAALLVISCSAAFDWNAFLFLYLDPMHDPRVQFRYSLGPAAIVLLTATGLFAGLGLSLFNLFKKRFRNLMILLRAAIMRGEEL